LLQRDCYARKEHHSPARALRTDLPRSAYFATAGFLLRSWARENPDTLVRYIGAYVEGLRWVMQPSNKAQSIALLANGLNISQDMAERSYVVAVDPQNGFARDAKIDMAGFRNVLKLRAELHGDWGGTPPAPEQSIQRGQGRRRTWVPQGALAAT
jgi:ABC-type nitrate/sulfonate/bicarbonate transport system substrate-binding protein